MAIFKITTTGTPATVTIDDLGLRQFTHPVVDFVISEEYQIEELRDSGDLRAAIEGAELTASLDDVAITSGALFDAVVEDFLNKRVSDSEADIVQIQSDITDLEGDSHVQNTDTKLAEGTADEVSANELRTFVDSKGQVNGLATLDGSGKVPTSQLPPLAIGEYIGNFADLTTALADAGVQASQRGDWFTVDTDGGQTYIVIADNPTTAVDVQRIKTPTDVVTSVNGETGDVTLTANEIGYTPSTSGDWNTVPTEVAGAADELASRVETLENTAAPQKKTWAWDVGDDGNINGDRDLKRPNSIATNLSPFVNPIASQIWGVSITSKQGTNVSFQIQIIVNGTVQSTQTITTADKLTANNLSIALAVGDEVRIRFIKTATNVSDVAVTLFAEEV